MPKKAVAIDTKALTDKQPISRVEWVSPDRLKPNDYNPNHQAPPEAKLLVTSIVEDGWTQPIVAFLDGTIVDGEHRWRSSSLEQVAKLTGGLVPVVWLDVPESHRKMSTIRHNRARGQHGVKPMSSVVRALLEDGIPKEQVMSLLGMEAEEVDRLATKAGMPERAGAGREFSKSWVPGDR